MRTSLPTGHSRQKDHQAAPSSQDDYQARTPSFKIAEKIFEEHRIQSSATAQTDALPGNMVHRDDLCRILTIKSILGIDLPSDNIVGRLVDSYFTSVQWYLPVLDEPSFRARLAPILESRSCSAGDQPFLMTVVVVMAIGAQFCAFEALRDFPQLGDVADLKSDLLSAIEINYLRTFDDNNLDWTVFALLLSSLYMLCRQPRRSFVVLGSAIRAAQNMRLDREETWAKGIPNDVEMCRRIWWALYCVDKHATIIGGKASMITYDFNVGPVSHALESRTSGDGELRDRNCVTIDTYNTLRCTLYQITSPLTNDGFHQKNKPLEDTFASILKLHQELGAWKRNLPHSFSFRHIKTEK
ncbi:hypothetical protein PT974_01761 [Cladobotryum mycophilum]|uniref:Xylanolytic transcriptional activator regulatory domain-containing protein n=1 Tax=Cladobotryum mycophilum TaxID=491253 RepID=A0ABR0SWC9_9HYPO